jgi:hypothetical protein
MVFVSIVRMSRRVGAIDLEPITRYVVGQSVSG